MSTLKPQPKRQLSSVDHVPSLRESTAHLLGAFIYRERTRRRISPEVLAAAVGRTQDWVAALERGSAIPTERNLLMLETEIVENGPHKKRDPLDLTEAARELEVRPYGQLAMSLRQEYDIPLELDTSPDSGAPIASRSANPVIASVRSTDRLLVLTPFLVSVALLFVGFSLLAGQTSAADIDWAMPVAKSGVLLTLAVFFLGALDSILAFAARFLRGKKARTAYRACERFCANHGLQPFSGSHWHATTHSRHLLLGARRDYVRHSTLADFAERLATAVLIAFLILGVAWFLQEDRGSVGRDFNFFMAGLTVLGVGVWRNANRAGRRAAHALARGCGYPLETVVAEAPPV